MSKESDEYEVFARNVIQELTGPTVTVHRQKPYTNRRTGAAIVIHVSFTTNYIGAALLFIVECKRHKNKVRVQDVRELRAIKDDLGAHKGIIITTKGFQKGAIEDAKANGIALAFLTVEPQKGELVFVVNVGQPTSQFDGFWQGNIRSSRTDFDRGFRFEGRGSFFSLLMRDETEAAWREKMGFDPGKTPQDSPQSTDEV